MYRINYKISIIDLRMYEKKDLIEKIREVNLMDIEDLSAEGEYYNEK